MISQKEKIAKVDKTEEWNIISNTFRICIDYVGYFQYNELEYVLELVRPFFRFAYTNKKLKYFNIPCSFDIETTSFYDNEEKRAIMYEWTFGIMGLCIIGRTWSEFEYLIDQLSKILDLNENKRLICYIHNESFEFQFMRKHFSWNKVFAIGEREPIYAITESGVEFRCSLKLSGYKLETLGKQLIKYPCKKLVGYLDYNKIRHSKTLLKPDTEILYCLNDVKVVMCYIMETIERCKYSIAQIPLTKTGFVRNYCRNMCFYEEGKAHKDSFKRLDYKRLINKLTLESDEYKQLKRAFAGGFTHANPFIVGV